MTDTATPDIEIETPPAPAPEQQDEFVTRLSGIYQRLKYSKKLKVGMKEVEGDLLDLLGVKLFTVYQSVDNGKEILASFKGGDPDDDDSVEIRVPFSPTSLAGYVALSQRALVIRNVLNSDELIDIHPRLQFDKRFSEAKGWKVKSMIIVPIKDEILLGVMQLINFEGDRDFNKTDLKHAMMVSQMLAKQFRSSLQSTQGPFDYLVQKNKITAVEMAELQNSVSLYGGSVTRSLMEEFNIEADTIGKSLEHYYRVPYMKYDSEHELPFDLLENIGVSYLRSNLWLPVAGDKEEAVILIDDPSDYQRIMEIQGVVNARNYVFRVGLPEHILQFLRGDADAEMEAGFEDVFSTLGGEGGIEIDTSSTDDEDESLAATSGIIQLVNRIITEAERLGASDIHIEPGKDEAPGGVRIRVDGICRELLKVPKEHCAALIARIKVISRLDISEKRLPQDGKCKLKIRGKKVELRVATVPTVQGESAVLRILAAGSALPLNKLNLSPSLYDKIIELSSHPHGLFLVVGPTGSGKTTTLHAVLGHINKPERKIWTAEDPVEITQPGLQQVQMLPKINFTFAAAMRAFLRADPDVILIGEMRDHETASIGIEASLTGHLVFSTLHTNSAPETITRLLDLGLDPVNFSDALLGVLAQRLMRTLCGKCKQSYKPDRKELDQLINAYGPEDFKDLGIDEDNIELCGPIGCSDCGDTGYKGRTGIHELLVGTNELQAMIYRKDELSLIREQAKKDGMLTMKQDAIEKIFNGLSDYQQLLRVVGE
ncbi:MAG: general secretion pathway protein GspE [SAR86 cluster bacterium]|uniref:General secretion pathway protein GspE n=1 Tax=SAR86 cluster bacterium TaxID=2030880 RepID=A0A2A5B919_9GAMM|nr:MAG: general secretion pathway protein GspE [SAR86 cluster bacterium]